MDHEREDFKTNVESYIAILREEKEQSKMLSNIRQQKRRVNDLIKQYMSQREIENAEIPHMATLRRVQKRRFLALKREDVEAWAREVIGGGERSLQEVDKLYDTREVKTSEELVVKPGT